jgi:hypothetical protein
LSGNYAESLTQMQNQLIPSSLHLPHWSQLTADQWHALETNVHDLPNATIGDISHFHGLVQQHTNSYAAALNRIGMGLPSLPNFGFGPLAGGNLPPVLGQTYRQVDLTNLQIEGPGGLSRGIGAEGGPGGVRVFDPTQHTYMQQIIQNQQLGLPLTNNANHGG